MRRTFRERLGASWLWLRGIGTGNRVQADGETRMNGKQGADFSLPESLGWLMDASLFIDSKLIGRYYDAIVRPLHKEGGRTIQITGANIRKIQGKLGIKGEVKPSDLVGKLISTFVDASVGVSGEIEALKESEKSRTDTIDLVPIETPHRQLEQLALHYLVNHTDRIFLENETRGAEWREPSQILDTPRALVFFNFPSQDEAKQENLPETRIIPAAAEFENGEIVPIYQTLKFGRWVPPEYPEKDGAGKDNDQLREERKAYWADFSNNYNATAAMLAVENAAKGRGRIRWIAFRVPLTEEGDSLHLHIQPAEQYDTGTFAYNFIKRGHKHGLRIVGMLKSEPDLNVLAVYEK